MCRNVIEERKYNGNERSIKRNGQGKVFLMHTVVLIMKNKNAASLSYVQCKNNAIV